MLDKSFNFLKPYEVNDLIRLGRNEDGGYIVSESIIKSSNYLLAFGMGADWSFEEDFLSKKKVPIYAYDAGVSKNFFLKELIKSAVRVDNLKFFAHWLKVLIRYKKFFSQPNVNHVQKYVLASAPNKHNSAHTNKTPPKKTSSQQTFSTKILYFQKDPSNVQKTVSQKKVQRRKLLFHISLSFQKRLY